jgi:hypothetical protein
VSPLQPSSSWSLTAAVARRTRRRCPSPSSRARPSS